MRALIIHGNTRDNSNTEALAGLFAGELEAGGAQVVHLTLRDKDVRTCVGCDKCHSILNSFGCVINDYMHEVAREMLVSDLVVFASPIYSWMPTPPLKTVMDRCYAFTKYPEGADSFNLLKIQKYAMIATSGDDCDTNCDLFDEAVRRMAKFAGLTYLGYLGAKDPGDRNMAKPDVIEAARVFALKCLK